MRTSEAGIDVFTELSTLTNNRKIKRFLNYVAEARPNVLTAYADALNKNPTPGLQPIGPGTGGPSKTKTATKDKAAAKAPAKAPAEAATRKQVQTTH